MIDTTQYTKLLMLKRHWLLAVAVGLTVVSIAVPVALGLPNVYSATAHVAVERQVGAASTQAAIESLETRLQKIKQESLSRGPLIALIDKFDLYPSMRKNASTEAVIDRVQHDILVTPQLIPSASGGQSTLSFSVSYMGDDRATVADVANEIAGFYVAQNSALRMTQISRSTQQLKNQLDEAQRHAEDADRRLQTFYTTSAGRGTDQLSLKSGELTRAYANLNNKAGEQSRLKAQRSTYETSIAQIEDEQKTRPPAANASTPEQKRARLQQELADLLAAGQRESGPDVRRVTTELQTLDRDAPTSAPVRPVETADARLSVLKRNLADTIHDLALADAKVTEYEGEVKSLEAQIRNASVRNPELEGLTNDSKAAHEVYEQTKRLHEQAVLAEGAERGQETEEFRIFEPARIPSSPSGPNRVNLILGSLLFAVVAGLGCAVARDQLDTSFHSLDELRTFTTVPVIGSIPRITTASQKARRITVMAVGASALVVGLAFVSVWAYHRAQHHIDITRLLSKAN